MYDLSIYKSKRVFITGHTGFKGSWLTLVLNKLGANVKGYALASADNELYSSIQGNKLCSSVEADIRDYERLKSEIETFAPDCIFHLAAQPLVLASYENPTETITTNINGTANLLEIVRKLDINIPVVIITTDKVYKNENNLVSFKESDSLGGNDIYSASKACTELLTQAYSSSFFAGIGKIVTARAGNVIGGGDFSENRIIPDYIRAYEKKTMLHVRNPDSIRPWQHVLDSLSGYLLLGKLLLEGSRTSHAYNFGPNESLNITVRKLIMECQSHTTDKVKLNFSSEKIPKESTVLMLDTTKAQEDLNWTPKWNIHETVKYTINWYLSKENVLKKTSDQINQYFNL